MLNYLKKLPKKIKIIGTVIFTAAFLCLLVIYNIERILETGVRKFLNINLKIENIDFSFGEITIEKAKIYDSKDRLMLDIPRMDIDYSLIKLAIKDLTVDSPNIFIIQDEDGVNIKESFSSNEEKKERKDKSADEKDKIEEQDEIYKASDFPVDNINVNNLNLSYKYLKNDKNIEKKLNNININLKSGRNKGIYAEISSQENMEKFNVIYSNREEPYYFDINLSNIKLENYADLIQSEIPKIEKISAELEADAIISQENMTGHIKFNSLDLYHRDIESEIKADLNIDLNKKDIDLTLDYEIFGEKDRIKAVYKDEILDTKIHLRNINQEKLSKIVPLREKKWDLSKVNIKDILLEAQYNKDKGLKISFDFKPTEVKLKGVAIDDIRANILIRDGIKYIDDSYVLLRIADMNTELKVDAEIEDKVANLSLGIRNLDKTSNLIPDFESKIKLKNEAEKILAEIQANKLLFSAEYEKESKKITLFNDNFNLGYNIEMKILGGEGKLDFSLYGLKNQIIYFIKDNIINFEKIKMKSEEDGEKELEATAFYDLNSKDFVFEYNSSNLIIERLYKGEKIRLNFQGTGKFEKYQNVFKGIGSITGIDLSYLGNINSVSGNYNLSLNEENELELEFNGKADELNYGKYKIKDVLIKLGFEKDILKIKKLGNNVIDISGKIDNKTQESNLNLSIKNLRNEDISFDKGNFLIKSMTAKVTGKLDNPTADIKIDKADIFIGNNTVKISGDVKLRDRKLSSSNLKFNDNRISGNYDINSQKYEANIVINDNIKNYLQEKDINYKVKGLAHLEGIGGNLKSYLKIAGNGQFKNSKLPDITLLSEYSARNYSDGILIIKEIILKNSSAKNLINLNGSINLKNKNIDINLDELIDLTDLKDYIKSDKFKGKIKLKGKINGKLDKILYNLDINSEELVLKNKKLTEINSKLKGDNRSLSIENLSFKYLNNRILGTGTYDITKKDYNFNIKTENPLALNFLNNEIKSKNISNIKGNAIFDISLNNRGLNGYLKIINFALTVSKENINISNFNLNMDLLNNEIKIENSTAKINNGLLKLNGNVKIPKDFKNITEKVDYLLDLEIENVNYDKADVGKFQLNSKLNINNKKIIGDINIDKGIIYDIPNDYKSIWAIISKKISKKKNEEKNQKKVKAKEKEERKKIFKEFLNKLDYMDLKLKTKEPIILDINNFNFAIGELKGKLDLDLAILGEKGKFYLTGNTEILNGYTYINTNKFILDRALVSFNKQSVYLPELDPDIFLDTRVDMDGEVINFSINGRLEKLVYKLSSERGRVSGDFNSLIAKGNNSFDFDLIDNEVFVTFMKNIIAGQLAQTIFSPITNVARKTLTLSKLIVKPEVLVYNEDSKNIGINNPGRSSEVYNLNLNLMAEKALYKDRVYLYGNAKVLGSDKNSIVENSFDKNGLKEYDVGIEYRTKDDKIIGIGIGTVPARYIYEDRNQKKRNYHIDFKIRKKYNSFSEIFSF